MINSVDNKTFNAVSFAAIVSAHVVCSFHAQLH